MQSSKLAKRLWLILFIITTGCYLWGLGALPLVGPDEPRYAEVAREMMVRHDLITPTLGGLPWFEKPPLLYWMMIASYRVLGVNEYAARLGPAICGLLTGIFIAWCGKHVVRRGDAGPESLNEAAVGRWSALVWFSSLGAIAFSRGASFDIVLTLTTTAALACFFVWGAGSERSARINASAGIPAGGSPASVPAPRLVLLFAFYFFAGLSLLAKGLIGFVIIFGVIAAFYLVRREFPERGFLKSLLWGVPLALVVAGVWYGPMIYRHGWTFIDQFIIQHHFARFATNKYHHPGPIYFYLPVLIGLSLPWVILLIASFISSRRWAWRGDSARDRVRVLALLWLVLPILFFSFSGSKLVAYILPVLPAVSLLAGERIDCFIRMERGNKVLRLTGALVILLAIAAVWDARARVSLNLSWLGLTVLPLLVAGVLAVIRTQLRRTVFVLISIASLATSVVAVKFMAPVAARAESVRDLLAAAAARGYSTTPVVQLHTVERTAEFYAANRIAYGSDGEPVKLEAVVQVIEAARRNNGSVLCFIPVEYESQLTAAQGLQPEVIGDNGRVALVLVRYR